MNLSRRITLGSLLLTCCSQSATAFAVPPPKPQLLEADAGVRIWSRSFRYTDTAAQLFPREDYGQPADFTVPAAPALKLGLETFPGLLLGDSWLSYLGVFTQMNLGFATKTKIATDEGTVSARNEYFNLLAGLKGRVPLGPIQIEPSFAFGTDSSSLEGLENQSSPLAGVSYSFLRPGISASGHFEKIYLEARGAYRIGLKVGEIGEQFPGTDFPPPTYPNTSYLGFDLGATIGYAVAKSWDLQVGMDLTQYGLDFNPLDPELQADLAAGGATDRYLSFWFGMSFHLEAPTPVQPAATEEAQEPSESEFDDDFDEF